jgi:hypothetical protein
VGDAAQVFQRKGLALLFRPCLHKNKKLKGLGLQTEKSAPRHGGALFQRGFFSERDQK